jgi:hypothetical protein
VATAGRPLNRAGPALMALSGLMLVCKPLGAGRRDLLHEEASVLTAIAIL